MIIKHKTGIWIRTDCSDANLMAEVMRYCRYCTFKTNDIILDIGGCFGGFSYIALINHVKLAVIIEPLPQNIKMVHKNMKQFKNVTVYNAAAVTYQSKAKSVLYFNPESNSFGSPSIVRKRGRKPIQIKTISFPLLLKKYRPTIIKMDCECAEYDLLLNTKIPHYVRQLIVEFHFGRKEFKLKSKDVVDLFKDWNCLLEPKGIGEIKTKRWNTEAIWERETKLINRR